MLYIHSKCKHKANVQQTVCTSMWMYQAKSKIVNKNIY